MLTVLIGWVVGQVLPGAVVGAAVAATDRLGVLAESPLRAALADPDAPAAEQYKRARLAALVAYQNKVMGRVAIGTSTTGDLFTLLQAARDTVDAGNGLSRTAGERVGWQAAGLDHARAMHRLATWHQARGWPPQAADQTAAQVELFREQLRAAVADCLR